MDKNNLLGVVGTLYKWKKFIFYTCMITAIGAVVTVLLLPVYYESTTIFYAASPDLATPEAIFGGSNQAPDYYGTGNDTERLITIAESGDLASFMIDSFHLYERYEIDPDDPRGPHKVRLKFDKYYDVVKTKYDAIELSVEDRDKEMAARMANAARNFIESTAVHLVKTSQKKLLQIFEQNINSKKAQLDTLNQRLQALRNRYGVYNTDAQSENLSELLAKAEARLYNARAKLEALQKGGGRRDTILLLQANIKGYENEMAQLTQRLNTFNEGMAQVEVLQSIQEKASEDLSDDQEHYKQIKAAYQSDFPSIILVEEAPVPLIKSRPKRALLVVAATAIAFIFSVIGVLIFDTYKEVDWKEVLGG